MQNNKTTRSDSMSSANSISPPTSPTSFGSRRPSSTLFASLHENKRPNDPRIQARRQSLSEQRPAPGVLGRMWNKFVPPYPPPPQNPSVFFLYKSRMLTAPRVCSWVRGPST